MGVTDPAGNLTDRSLLPSLPDHTQGDTAPSGAWGPSSASPGERPRPAGQEQPWVLALPAHRECTPQRCRVGGEGCGACPAHPQSRCPPAGPHISGPSSPAGGGSGCSPAGDLDTWVQRTPWCPKRAASPYPEGRDTSLNWATKGPQSVGWGWAAMVVGVPACHAKYPKEPNQVQEAGLDWVREGREGFLSPREQTGKGQPEAGGRSNMQEGSAHKRISGVSQCTTPSTPTSIWAQPVLSGSPCPAQGQPRTEGVYVPRSSHWD